MNKNLLESIVAGALLQGCAYGSVDDDVTEVMNGQIEAVEPNCLLPTMEKCWYRAQANTVMDLEITPFEIDDFRTEFTAFDFSPETETMMLSYATTNKDNKNGIVQASAGDRVSLPDGSTVYVGKIDFENKWAFLYYVSKDVRTREINLLASGDHKTTSEDFAFSSSCFTRDYNVEVFRTGESMPNGYVGPGTVLSWKNPWETTKAIFHDQAQYADGFGLWSYGYGMDAFLCHQFNAGEDFARSIVYFFEDAYKCE